MKHEVSNHCMWTEQEIEMDCSMVPGLRMLSGKLRDLELTIDFFSYSAHDTFECQNPPPFKTFENVPMPVRVFYWMIFVFIYFSG